jgi:putative glycosyltransferase (TIGR04372 family)
MKLIVFQYLGSFVEKQKGKKLLSVFTEILLRILSLFIFPFVFGLLAFCALIRPVKFGFLYHERLGHLALNTDLYLRRRYLGAIPKNEIHIFFVYLPANKQLVRMFSREMILINSEFMSKLFSPIGLFRTCFHIPLPFIGNEYDEFYSAPPQISFTDKENLAGRRFMESLGITDDQWYACFFARDSQYYKIFSPNTDATFSDHRNADIDTYTLAAQAVLSAGGWVIRMGSCVEKPFNFKHSRVIDYASKYRNDFADIYITANARFYVGTTSGASDIAVLFDIPFVGVNWVPVGYSPFGKDSIYIPKRILTCEKLEEVPISEQLNEFIGNQISVTINPSEVLSRFGWCFLNNTAEEIRDIVNEMLRKLDGEHVDDLEIKFLTAWYAELMPLENIYRKTPSKIGTSFLKRLHKISTTDKCD